jgi:hypothetical protein
MMPAGERPTNRLPAGIVVLALRFVCLTPCLLLGASLFATQAFAKDDYNAVLSGRVRFEGTPPPRPVITMALDRACDSMFAKGRPADSLIVGEDGGLANAIVHVVSGLPKDFRAQPPAGETSIELKGCAFSPHVVAMRAGAELAIVNRDATLHRVSARSGANPPFQDSMPGEGMELRKSFSRPEVAVGLRSDNHPWMAAFVGVFDHPYYAVTAPDGSFSIPGLPEGEYLVEVWHETLGTRSVRLELDEGARASVEVSFAGN